MVSINSVPIPRIRTVTTHENIEVQEIIAKTSCGSGAVSWEFCSMQMESLDRLQAKWQGRRIHFLEQRYFRKL